MVEKPAGECQFTVNALICMNPLLEGDGRFSVYPIGSELGLREDPGQPGDPNSLVINGYAVYAEFVPIYQKLSQSLYAGDPISPVHMNYERERIEQYFSNVGFYRNFSDPPGTIKLLAYGAAACDDCSYQPAAEASVLDGALPSMASPLLDDLISMDDASVFGEALTTPYPAADGNVEQVYESVVLYREISSGLVRFRPLSILLGLPAGTPGQKLYGSEKGLIFYAVQGDLGYHVPVAFYDFINKHGGIAQSGDPIAEAIETQPGAWSQCFVSYCLELDPAARKDSQVSVTKLGSQFLQFQAVVTPVVEATAVPAVAPPSVILQVSEINNPLSSAEQQQISILLLNAADQLPLAGYETTLIVNLPENKTYTAVLPSTLADGTSTLTLPVMKNIPNGTIITYQVCTKNLAGSQVCQSDNFLVWEDPASGVGFTK